MEIVLNEKDFAKNAIQNCILGQKPGETLMRVAKYYYSEGYKKSEIAPMLESFMIKCDPTINTVKWGETIEGISKSAAKSKLIEIDGVPITKAELDLCDQIDGKQMKRLLFTLICLAKLHNMMNPDNNNWVNKEDKDIFKLANVVTSLKRQSLMLNDLRELGLIKFSRKVDNININVTCLDNDGDPELIISDYRNLGYQYLRYCGEPYFECQSCGLVIKKTSNSRKYCHDCAEEMNRKRAAETGETTHKLANIARIVLLLNRNVVKALEFQCFQRHMQYFYI